jgi:hypothetical protein
MKTLQFEHKTFPPPDYFQSVSGFLVADYNEDDRAPVISTEEAYAQDREALPENRIPMVRAKREWPEFWMSFSDKELKEIKRKNLCILENLNDSIESKSCDETDLDRLNAFMLKHASTLVYRWRKLNRNMDLLMCDVQEFLKINVHATTFQKSFFENALPNHKIVPHQSLEAV